MSNNVYEPKIEKLNIIGIEKDDSYGYLETFIKNHQSAGNLYYYVCSFK